MSSLNAKVELKESLKVICVNPYSSAKLIKGAVYLADSLSSYTWGSKKGKKYVCLKDVGTYKADYFTTYDGQPLQDFSDFHITQNTKSLDPRNKDYTSEYIRCRYSTSKNLKKDEIYYVEKQIKNEIITTNHRGANLKHYEYKLKLRGIKLPIKSLYAFEEIPIIEQRKFKLKNIKGEKIKTGEQTRKFLLYSEKEKVSILFEILSKVLLDLSKINNTNDIQIDIIDLMIRKDSRYGLTREDIEPFLKETIQESVNKISR